MGNDRQMMKTKVCTKCEKRKVISKFYRNKNTKDGFHAACKTCHANYHQKYQKIHKVEDAKYHRDYRKTIAGCLRSRLATMKRRCNCLKHKDYKYYGGRGIEVKFKSSDEFINYVIGELKIDPRYFVIDRINNDGHYEKGNIRFVTVAENNRNKRKHGR